MARILIILLTVTTAVTLGSAVHQPAQATEDVLTIRYDHAHEIGAGNGQGGMYAALRSWPRTSIPAWARSATVRVTDDRGLPVAGAADLYEARPPQWVTKPRATSRLICSSAERTFHVPPGGTMHLRMIAGVLTNPADARLIGVDGTRSGPCAVAPSTPTSGVIIITFQA